MAREKAKGAHYVDNKLLYAEMTKSIEKYNKHVEEGKQPPKVTDYIGSCIYLIATKMATKGNFSAYTYKEDMIGDAIETCLRYIHNFDPTKYSNPFAYFTQIVYFAFLRRIEKEQKQSYIRYKCMESSSIFNGLAELPPGDREQFNVVLSTMDIDKLATLSAKYDKPKKVKKSKDAPPTGVETFIEETDE